MSDPCSSACFLAETVEVLRDEVLRLHQAVSRLEAHAAGKTVRARDLALTVAGVTLSITSAVLALDVLGVLP